MNQYVISPEDCLILIAIRNSKSLREAASLLDCDAGGLLRKVQRISEEHDLLRKTEGKWHLTNKGLLLVTWTQETIQSQKSILLSESALRIASTSWFSERALIPKTAQLLELLSEKTEIQYFTPEGSFEKMLTDGECDFVINCHPPENPSIAHKQLAPEKWSVVLATQLAKKHLPKGKRITLEMLANLPFIRHHGLNPHSVFPIEGQQISNSNVSLDNLIGIRAALVNGLGWSFVPTALIKDELENKTLLSIDHDIQMNRKVCLWWLRGSASSRKKSAVLAEWLRVAYSRF